MIPSYFSYFNYAAYYQLSHTKRDIVDSLSSTDGTMINWRMMHTVILQVDNLDYLVEYHNAGDYDQGALVVPMLHTLNWTNSENYNKHVVSSRSYHFINFASYITYKC